MKARSLMFVFGFILIQQLYSQENFGKRYFIKSPFFQEKMDIEKYQEKRKSLLDETKYVERYIDYFNFENSSLKMVRNSNFEIERISIEMEKVQYYFSKNRVTKTFIDVPNITQREILVQNDSIVKILFSSPNHIPTLERLVPFVGIYKISPSEMDLVENFEFEKRYPEQVQIGYPSPLLLHCVLNEIYVSEKEKILLYRLVLNPNERNFRKVLKKFNQIIT